LIIYSFTSRSRIFHLYGDVTIAGEGLQNLGICSALRAFEQGGIFIVPHLLWHGTSVFSVSSEGPPHSVASYTHFDYSSLFSDALLKSLQWCSGRKSWKSEKNVKTERAVGWNQTECHEIEPIPSKDRVMPEGDNHSLWDELILQNSLFSAQFNSYSYFKASNEVLSKWAIVLMIFCAKYNSTLNFSFYSKQLLHDIDQLIVLRSALEYFT
jgi:hypothetical protein